MKARVRTWLVAIAGMPLSLRVVLFVVALLHGTALSWGMPASDAWDNDGVAPRDFLPGLASTFTPGDFYTYPPLHLALLAVLTAPFTVAAAINAGTTRIPAVLDEILSPSYMTPMAMTARIVALLMSLGIVVALAKIAEAIVPRETSAERRGRVATATAIVAGLGVSFTYYAHTSNLDVPCLFWASLGALGLVRAIALREPRRFRGALVFAAMAVATKDQGYAIFVVALPLGLALWLSLDPWARKHVIAIARELAIGGAFAVVLLVVVDGALFNPSGFRARLAFLGGSASQDYATYPPGPGAWPAILADVARELRVHYPYVVVLFYLVGLVVAFDGLRRAVSAPALAPSPSPSQRAADDDRSRAVASLLPLAFALSFTIAFNMTARRVEERFTLPQALFLAVYGGVGLERVWSAARGPVRVLARAGAVAIGAWALWQNVCLVGNLILEPRYRTEAFLARNVRAGDVVEVHGLNVYLPRFSTLPPGAKAVRVGLSDPKKRGRIPGLDEAEGLLADIDVRKPRFIVVSQCYAWRFRPPPPQGARVAPVAIARTTADADATTFFDTLFGRIDGARSAYRLVDEARVDSPVIPKMNLHASLGCPMFTFERDEAR